MIYQNDSYSFTLSLTREDTSVVDISSVSYSPSISADAIYTFSLISGPYPHLGNKITVVGMAHLGNNGTFTITDLDYLVDSAGIMLGGTFHVTNTSAVTATEAGTGTIDTTPNVTSVPYVQIIRLSDSSPILGVPAAMAALDSSQQIWIYTWDVGSALAGEYIAIASYAVDGNIFSGKFVEKIRVGDSRIIGTVALDATVAKDATAAKDATVAKATDLAAIDPNTSSIVLAIKGKTDNLPADPTGMTLLGDTIQDVADVHDAILGNQIVDKTQNPAVFQIKRLNNSILAQYHLADDNSETSRTKF